MLLKSEKATIEAGKKFAAKLNGGDIVLLEGVLGAGKTTFVKGMAEFFGIKKKITSPTFALMNVYPVKSREAGILAKPKLFNRVNPIKSLDFVHIDTYRLKNEQELIDIGIEDYLGAPNTICVIEWPEKLKKILEKKSTIKVEIKHLGDGRDLVISNF